MYAFNWALSTGLLAIHHITIFDRRFDSKHLNVSFTPCPPSEGLAGLQPLQNQHGVSASVLLAGFRLVKGPLKGCHTSGICLAPTGSDGVARRLGASGVGRRDGVWFNASALHVRDQLVGDLCQDVLSQSRHAQHVVSRAIHVVPERDKLLWQKKSWESAERLTTFRWRVQVHILVQFHSMCSNPAYYR